MFICMCVFLCCSCGEEVYDPAQCVRIETFLLKRRIGGFLIRGVPRTSITVTVWFPGDLGVTEAALLAAVL